MNDHAAALALAGTLLIAGCSKAPAPESKPAAASQAEEHSTTGVIREVQQGGKVLVIEHQEFPGFMEAMTMPYEVTDLKLSQGLKAGDSIEFSISKAGDSWVVSKLAKRP
jgi:Cu/Ag efflux protein CusF